ncbi:amino acid ABC transporter membrane protein 1 (PAAT family) [Gibbsiella quercinecans]|uniref:ABC transporter permease n=1 Tax=Gibbsiella quercinecans TaxID=929813 RepID=A0A250B833_9GAMM|nr:amino acid ABC transporter permease [Gibbsiella quercinecans]ATA22265.1 ABC transporter permease [Gibbsiella quercinecans]RLM02452.1 ABC transporter permease [Gibbsiella quercinecans]RLM03262.1 ABC transporter permease [Gibbsiella quercinecans]TCT92205.1 amino acid ABC transporter membrane protein 1 (PAAT family) [Gibbsiella quercinecans]
MQDYQFYWSIVFAALPQLLSGAWVTLQITLLSVVFGMVFAIPMSVARQSKKGWGYYISSGWVELSRNTPVLFQVYLMYFGLGALGINISSYLSVLIAITFNNAGYLAEIFRGGLKAIPRQQMATARSLGMNQRQAFQHVIFPQVFKVVFLPFVTQAVWAMLNTSLGMLVGLRELSGATQYAQSVSFRTFEFFIVTAGIYYAIAKIIQFAAMGAFRLMYRR